MFACYCLHYANIILELLQRFLLVKEKTIILELITFILKKGA